MLYLREQEYSEILLLRQVKIRGLQTLRAGSDPCPKTNDFGTESVILIGFM
jgi:hypothetical protein